ncbi:MAG: hypothetical protein CM1200mP18_18780 [Gammaproteobacteria bacterium]|nr:MAG: hypothetical protein CM1200mP18_18780 [Gammaproteobacteria bacterium]
MAVAGPARMILVPSSLIHPRRVSGVFEITRKRFVYPVMTWIPWSKTWRSLVFVCASLEGSV